MRVASTSIPTEKRVVIALTYVYGIGPTRAEAICKRTGISPDIRVKDLTPEQEQSIRDYIKNEELVLEADLRREVTQNVKRLQDIGSFRGYRHRRRLPVRGQRSKTNARTRRGKRVTIANKKIATK